MKNCFCFFNKAPRPKSNEQITIIGKVVIRTSSYLLKLLVQQPMLRNWKKFRLITWTVANVFFTFDGSARVGMTVGREAKICAPVNMIYASSQPVCFVMRRHYHVPPILLILTFAPFLNFRFNFL